MKLAKNKTIAIAIAIILTTSIGASITLLPTVRAHDPPWEIPTYAHITAAPNPIGVGQQVNVFMFLTNYYYGAQYSTDDLRFHNYKLTITAPNGEVTTQTFETIVDTTAAQLAQFTPDQTGVYNLTFTYPGETYTSTREISTGLGAPVGPNPYTNDTFKPSSASTTLTVQEEPIPPAITSYPLPAEYWTRPIYGENTDWWSISSNWLGAGAPNYGGYSNAGADASRGGQGGMAVFPGDAIGPLTSHVMWTKPLQSGGVVGGDNFNIQGQTFFDGSAYLIRYDNPIILDGMLFYTEPVSFTNTGYNQAPHSGYGPVVCVDLRTGEEIWSRTDVFALSFGLIMDVQTQNEHGVCPPVIVAAVGSTWIGYDAYTGNWLFNVTNVPTFGSARAMGPNGEYLNYIFDNAGNETNPDWRLGQWNSTKIFLPGTSAAPSMTGVKDGSLSTGTNTRYDWNISIPWRNTMTSEPVVVAAKYGDGILCYNGTLPSNGGNMLQSHVSSAPYTYFFVNLDPSKGAVGSVSWWNTLQPPANNYTVIQAGVDWESRAFLQSYKEGIIWTAYSLDSGRHLWTAEPQAAFDYYGSPSAGLLSGQIAYGKLYSCAMSGILYCYDMKTGDLLWTYGNGGEGNSTNSGFNWPYGNIPTFVNAIGNDVVYLVTSEHTWTTPIYKGGLARAVNATTGDEIWTISSVTMEFGGMSYAIADGFATWFNGYDNQIYVVGRGPSTTTVIVSPKVQNQGSSIIVEGRITDISSGTTQEEQAARFPDGVPVASDASMKDWMGYVYQQKPLPSNATGVTVSIDIIDTNGNFRNIGTTTTDLSGAFSYTWTPDIPGKYTLYASFAGTNGYWPSSAQTSFAVDEVEDSSTEPPVVNAPNNELYFVASTIAIIIAIAIVGILILRKRP